MKVFHHRTSNSNEKSNLHYLVHKYYYKPQPFDVYDPYFLFMYVYIDYLGNRFKNQHGQLYRLLF